MTEKLDPRILVEDARYRHGAVVALITSIDAQAMRFMRLYVTIGIAAAAGAVSSFFSKSPAFPATVGWALAAAVLMLLLGTWFCFRVLAPTPISLPGRPAEFWLWSLNEGVTAQQVLVAYLENLEVKTAQNDELNRVMIKTMQNAKLAGMAAPFVALLTGVVAAILAGA